MLYKVWAAVLCCAVLACSVSTRQQAARGGVAPVNATLHIITELSSAACSTSKFGGIACRIRQQDAPLNMTIYPTGLRVI